MKARQARLSGRSTIAAEFWSEARHRQFGVDGPQRFEDALGKSWMHVWGDHQAIVATDPEERGPRRGQVVDGIDPNAELLQVCTQRFHRRRLAEQQQDSGLAIVGMGQAALFRPARRRRSSRVRRPVDAHDAMAKQHLGISLLFASSLLAQGVLTLPPSHASNEGTSSTNVPFGRSTPTRVQYVWDAMLFSAPVVLTGVSLRLDGNAAAAAKIVDCELRLSTTPNSLVNLNVNFAANRGADETVVVPRQLLQLPAGPAAATPSPFLPPIPFTTPFSYQPANGGLLLEIVVFGQPPGSYSIDVTWVCNSPEVPFGPAACVGTNGLPVRVESSTTQVIWGRPWVARVLDASPGSFVVLALGTFEAGPWAGMLLPQDLVILGAPGCFLSIDLAGTWISIAAGDGSAAFPFLVPNSPYVLGEWIRFQGGAFDAAANPLGLVTSQARKVQVCGWEPVGRVWSSGVGATFGTREVGLGAVVRFTTQ